MFCTKCGNQMPDGSNFCTRCGNGVNNTNYFAGGATLSKKEYFKTACSEKAKSLIKAGWIVFVIFALCLALTMTLAFFGVNAILDNFDFERELPEMIDGLETLTGENLGEVDDILADFDLFKQEFGMSLNDAIRLAFNIILGVVIASNATVLILSLFAVWKKSLPVSIIALVFATMSAGNLLNIGCTIFFLVRACILRKEYKRYCEASVSYSAASFGGQAYTAPAPASAPAAEPVAKEEPVVEEVATEEAPAAEETPVEEEAPVVEEASEAVESANEDGNVFSE